MTANLSCVRCLIRQARSLKFDNRVRGIATKGGGVDIPEKNDKLEDKSVVNTVESEDLAEPTTCCMSGCLNCVWIEYAEKLSKTMEDSSEDVQKILMDKIQDPNMRAFLSFELRIRNLIR